MKNKFIKSTIILVIGGIITKILGMVIKIVMTRLIGTTGIGIYTLIMPTFSLLVTLAQLGLPVAISKLISEEKIRSKKIILPIVPVSLIINGIIIIIMLLTSNFIATYFLHSENCSLALACCGFVLPFISISSILRGYFFGKQKMFPHVLSNIVEDVVRLIILIIGIPLFLKSGINITIAFIILSNIICEIASIIVFLFFLPKNNIKIDNFKYDKEIGRDIFSISLPTTGSRLIGNLTHFLEPIILTNVLMSIGYSNGFIVYEYGILNGYVMPLLLLPSFFTMAISQAILPIISNLHSNNKKRYAYSKLKQAISFSLIIGIPITILFMSFPKLFLSLIYNTTEGVSYLVFLAPFFLLYYIQVPLTAALQAIDRSRDAMKITLFSGILKLVILFVLSNFKIGMWGLIISIVINIIYVTTIQFIKVRKFLLN